MSLPGRSKVLSAIIKNQPQWLSGETNQRQRECNVYRRNKPTTNRMWCLQEKQTNDKPNVVFTGETNQRQTECGVYRRNKATTTRMWCLQEKQRNDNANVVFIGNPHFR
ncbi:hypothetical protein WDU94_004538 [Cyamophila willieti]